MKTKKTFKSLAELSTDSIGLVSAEPEKEKSPEPKVLAKASRKIPPNTFPQIPDLHHWGINE